MTTVVITQEYSGQLIIIVMSLGLSREHYWINYSSASKFTGAGYDRILRGTVSLDSEQGAVLLTVGWSYVGNDVTHSTLLDRAWACSYENLPIYRFYRVSNTAPWTEPERAGSLQAAYTPVIVYEGQIAWHLARVARFVLYINFQSDTSNRRMIIWMIFVCVWHHITNITA